ncbi:MAG: FAD-dependent monooxygenase [Pseudomonadales bacterium]
MSAVIATAHKRIAVIGGGLVGAAAALMAERAGAEVTLFEPRPPAPLPPPPQALCDWPIRHVALARASLDLLEGLGVDMQFQHGVFGAMQVWEQLGTASLSFAAADADAETLGWMAELPAVIAALWQRLAQLQGVTTVTGSAVDAVQPDGAGWSIVCGHEHRSFDLVLAADGARSVVRTALAVAAPSRPTGHHALATVVRTEQAHNNIARQRFLVEGPLALLPTRDPRTVSIVWSQPPAQATRRLALDDQAFCKELTDASEGALGAVQAVGQRAGFPIAQQLAASFRPRPGVALIGDAARVLHPLAGLGVNLGLEDVAALRPVLQDGSERSWAAWSRQRRARGALVQTALTTLQQTYGARGPWWSLLRNSGVRLINRSDTARRLLVREALGL